MNVKQSLALAGIGFSLLLLLHGLWQLDLICCGPVWSYGYIAPLPRLADQFFQCGFWFKTTVGNAYDFYLGLSVFSWFVLLFSMFYLFYFERMKVKRLKKEILRLREISRIDNSEGN